MAAKILLVEDNADNLLPFQLQSDHKHNAILRVSLPEPNGIYHDS